MLRAIDTVQVRTCWEIGRHIVEFEQGGAARAEYGEKLISRLSESLTGEFGKGFDERNLRNMRAFCDTLLGLKPRSFLVASTGSATVQ